MYFAKGWVAVAAGCLAFGLVTACARAPQASPDQILTIAHEATGVEYAVSSYEDYLLSPVANSRLFHNASAPPPAIEHRNIAVLLRFSSCRNFASAYTAFLRDAGGFLGPLARRDTRSDGHEAGLGDPNVGNGIFLFASPTLRADVIESEVARCKAYDAANPGLKHHVFAVLVRVEDSPSSAAFYDRYVEDVVFANTHASFSDWAVQEFIIGMMF